MLTKTDLYDLYLDSNRPCFLAFDPSDYTEIRGYQSNPAFQDDGMRIWLDNANQALACFTRDTKYESEVEERYTFKSKRQKAKALRESKAPISEFTTTLFQAFKRNRKDFESAVLLCCQYLNTQLDKQEYEHTEILLKGNRKLSLTTEDGHNYAFHNLLGAFALWKIDRALLAAKSNLALDMGEIILYAEGGTTTHSGTLNASGHGLGQQGGTVQILGKQVALLSGSSIDASGYTKGGTVHVGGEYQGKGATPTAKATYVDADSTITVRATHTGDGGKAIIWADGQTGFYGHIDARGGELSGNGGFVETSGKEWLDFNGRVNTTAAHGMTGTLLLDPTAITISNGANAAVWDGTNFTGAGAASILNVTTLESQLDNTNVIITTASGGAGTGDILVSNDITWGTTGASDGKTLTLIAVNNGIGTGNITVNAEMKYTGASAGAINLYADNNITIGGAGAIRATGAGKLDVLLNSDRDANVNGGYITIAAGGNISSHAGNITLGGGNGVISAGVGYAVGNAGSVHGITVNGTVDAQGGHIIANGKGFDTTTDTNYGMIISGAVKTSAFGTAHLTGIGGGNTDSGGNNGLRIHGLVSTFDGNLRIDGTGGGAGIGTSNLGIGMNGAGSHVTTSGQGNIIINATGGNATGSGGNNFGLYLSPTVQGIITTGTGGITIVGKGGNNAGSGTQNYGIANSGGRIMSNGGALMMTGIGGTSSGISNFGIRLTGVAGMNSNVGGGTITLVGIGGGTANSGSNYGLHIGSGATVSTVNGDIIVTNTIGGGAGSGTGNHGVDINAANSTIKTTGNGNINIAATGGNSAGTGSDNYGIHLTAASSLQTSGPGKITVSGTGGASTGGTNIGIKLDAGSITSVNGAVSLTGAGAGTGADNYGISLQNTAAITSTGAASITLNGTGADGAFDIHSSTGANTLGSGTNTGNITVIADTLSLANFSAETTTAAGSISIRPRTAGTTVGIGAGAGTLQLTDALLNSFTLSGTLFLGGDASWNKAGDMVIDSARTYATPTQFVTAGTIALNSVLTSSASGTSLVLAAGNNFTNTAGASAINPGAGRYLVYSTDPSLNALDGLTGFDSRYGSSYAGYGPASVTGSQNMFLYRMTLSSVNSAAAAFQALLSTRPMNLDYTMGKQDLQFSGSTLIEAYGQANSQSPFALIIKEAAYGDLHISYSSEMKAVTHDTLGIDIKCVSGNVVKGMCYP